MMLDEHWHFSYAAVATPTRQNINSCFEESMKCIYLETKHLEIRPIETNYAMHGMPAIPT